MRILFLSFGPQSGVIASLAGALSTQGRHDGRRCGGGPVISDGAAHAAVAPPRQRPQRAGGPAAVRRGLEAILLPHGFRLRLDEPGGRAGGGEGAARGGHPVGLGICAAPRPVPLLLYLDHTYAISKRYAKVDGLPDAGRMSGDYEAAERAAYHAADAVLTMSDFVRRSVIDDYGVDPGRVHVIGAGPDLDPLPGEPAGPPGWPPTVLFVGADFARKGGPTLLEAFQAVRGDVPEARLVIVGPRRAGGPLPGVTWAGRLGHGEMPALYASASVFALPTLREPFGLVFLEAMAFGLPCVGTKVEAVPEMIEDGVTGYVVPPGDAAALSVALRSLLRDREAASRMGRARWEKVRNYYTWDAVAGRVMKFLAEILNQRNGLIDMRLTMAWSSSNTGENETIEFGAALT